MLQRPEPLADLDWSQVAELLERARDIVLTTHQRADTDGIGSQLALCRALRQRGKRVHILNSEPLPANLAFLDPEGSVESYTPEHHTLVGQADLVVLLDVNQVDRLGAMSGAVAEREGALLVLDHHSNRQREPQGLEMIVPAAASTGVLVYDLLLWLGVKIDARVAQAVYATIVADTGSFRFSNTNASVLRVAADLVELGADPQRVYQGVLADYSPARYRLMARAMGGLELDCEQRLAWFFVSREVFAETGASAGDLDGLVEHMRLLRGVEVTLLMVELDEQRLRVSLRCEDGHDVNRLASRWGGGGHVHAAGAVLEGPVGASLERVLAAARGLFEPAAGAS